MVSKAPNRPMGRRRGRERDRVIGHVLTVAARGSIRYARSGGRRPHIGPVHERTARTDRSAARSRAGAIRAVHRPPAGLPAQPGEQRLDLVAGDDRPGLHQPRDGIVAGRQIEPRERGFFGQVQRDRGRAVAHSRRIDAQDVGVVAAFLQGRDGRQPGVGGSPGAARSVGVNGWGPTSTRRSQADRCASTPAASRIAEQLVIAKAQPDVGVRRRGWVDPGAGRMTSGSPEPAQGDLLALAERHHDPPAILDVVSDPDDEGVGQPVGRGSTDGALADDGPGGCHDHDGQRDRRDDAPARGSRGSSRESGAAATSVAPATPTAIADRTASPAKFRALSPWLAA